MIGPGKGPLLSDVGGILMAMINDTGLPSVKGTIVDPSSSVDNGVKIEDLDGKDPIGVMYSDGVPDGDLVFITVTGKAHLLVEDGTTVTSNEWAGTSGIVAGRVDAATEPPSTVKHDQEVGHFIESKAPGVDQLALAMIHFR